MWKLLQIQEMQV